MGMIYGNSNHPVEVKKIKLKVWSLRKEIEGIIRSRLQNANNDKISLEDLIQEYIPSKGDVIELNAAPADPDATDEFSDAMAQAMENPDEAEASAEGPEEEEKKEGDDSENSDEASEGGDDEASKLAEQMLEGQNESGDEKKADKKFDGVIRFHRPQIDEDDLSLGVTFLSDINMGDICFFSSQSYISGQTIVIDFLVPKRFSVTAEVVSCKNYNIRSRIISSTRPSFRIHSRFSFIREGERTLLRQFVKSIEPEIPVETAAPKAKEEEEDDFDDLDDLGI